MFATFDHAHGAVYCKGNNCSIVVFYSIFCGMQLGLGTLGRSQVVRFYLCANKGFVAFFFHTNLPGY